MPVFDGAENVGSNEQSVAGAGEEDRLLVRAGEDDRSLAMLRHHFRLKTKIDDFWLLAILQSFQVENRRSKIEDASGR